MNDYSLGMKVTLGEADILLLADIEAASEHDLIESDYDLQAEIIKVPHHGSTTSSTFDNPAGTHGNKRAAASRLTSVQPELSPLQLW